MPWEWDGPGFSFNEFVDSLAKLPNAADYVCDQKPAGGISLGVMFRKLTNGKQAARTGPYLVYDPDRTLPAQVVASWCDTLGLDTDAYGLKVTLAPKSHRVATSPSSVAAHGEYLAAFSRGFLVGPEKVLALHAGPWQPRIVSHETLVRRPDCRIHPKRA